MLNLQNLFASQINVVENFITINDEVNKQFNNQDQTRDIFSEKWGEAEKYEDIEKSLKFQREWFLSLYGFSSEDDLRDFLKNKNVIIDTGCGLGYKAAWFAKLAPHCIVLGVDISDSIFIAAKNYKDLSNLFFFKGDIAKTGIKKGVVDFTVCDQVIMHTESPEETFSHLCEITSDNGEFACYVYSKKALPRELIDTYFREETHKISLDKMWEFSSQLTELGKRLSELNITFESPEIPLLGIKGGTYEIQRFIYWNFLKCFWKDDWGFELSKSTNFDWYAPSNAKRFSKEEFVFMAQNNNMKIIFLHSEEACYSGRFCRLYK
jgi:SAM-dependent methyltransferase